MIMNASAGAADKEALAARVTDTFRAAGVDARIVLVRKGEKIGDVAGRALMPEVYPFMCRKCIVHRRLVISKKEIYYP